MAAILTDVLRRKRSTTGQHSLHSGGKPSSKWASLRRTEHLRVPFLRVIHCEDEINHGRAPPPCVVESRLIEDTCHKTGSPPEILTTTGNGD